MNVANEIHLLWVAVTLALALIGSLGFQVAHLLKRLRALENPSQVQLDVCVHGYVRPCPVCDPAESMQRAGTLEWRYCGGSAPASPNNCEAVG